MTPYYQDSAVQIFHGDCREVLPYLPKVGLVLTDPPYGIEHGIVGRPTKWQRLAGRPPEEWDKRVDSDLFTMIDNLGSEIILWGGNYYFLPPCRGWLSWYKPDAPPSMAHFELAWRNVDCNARQITYSIGATNAERVNHPTQKPLAVMRWSLNQAVTAEGIILDPFMGSGTTLRAAKDFSRPAIGVDISEEYCEIAAKRMSQEVLAFS